MESRAKSAAARRTILDAVPFSIIVTDVRGRIRDVNPAATALLGYGADELIGSSLTAIDGIRRARYDDGSPVLTEVTGDDAEWAYRRRDGSLAPVQESIVPLEDLHTGEPGFLIVAYDITHRLEARQRVEHLVTHDSLTNLPNRTLLVRHLERAVERATAEHSRFALVLLDLDHFKRVNDSLGHHIGDELILVVAERLLAWTRTEDLVARLGGDEFVMVLHDIEPGVALDRRLEQLMVDVLAPVVVHGYELVVTGSVGGTCFPDDATDPVALLKHADIAMYQAKGAGRNVLRWFEPWMVEESDGRLALSAALRQALELGELSLAFQPQIDLATGGVVGVEALARWVSPVLGQVPPDQFIPVAEDGGMIVPLGGWVLRTACQALARIQEELGRPLRLAVNVSPRQLRGSAWLEEIAEAVSAAGIAPAQLEVEITEGLLLEDRGDVVAMLEALRSIGVSIVVDDFGRGYSSLAYLTRFPIDKIKIDRSFIQEITRADTDAAIVDAIIVMAHALGMTVVAEGVETEVQERYLRERGCDEVQGYRYSPGVPADTLPMVARALSR